MSRKLPPRPDPRSDDMVAEAAWALAVTRAWMRYHRMMLWAWRGAMVSCVAAFVLMWVAWGTWTAAIAPFAAVAVVGACFALDYFAQPDPGATRGKESELMPDAEYEVIEQRTRDARATIRGGEELPTWRLEEWVNALAVKLGHAAHVAGEVGTGELSDTEPHRLLFMASMEALAAVAQDAWVACQEGRLR